MGKVLDLSRYATDSFGLYNYLYQAVEQELVAQLNTARFVGALGEAVTYAVLGGGKRVRPVFSLLLCQDLGGNPQRLLPAATAIEYLHDASLVHDDLPGLDNDDMRRGRPSCHKQFGEATAVLAGDALVGFAFEKLCEARLSEGRRLALVRALSGAYTALCNGQELDITLSDDLLAVYELKTGALFGAAAEFAAIAAEVGEKAAELCRRLGSALGVYFQIVDDYIDAHGNLDSRGRIGASDQRNQKTTFFRGRESEAERAVASVRGQIEESLRILQGIDPERPAVLRGARLIVSMIEARMGDVLRNSR